MSVTPKLTQKSAFKKRLSFCGKNVTIADNINDERIAFIVDIMNNEHIIWVHYILALENNVLIVAPVFRRYVNIGPNVLEYSSLPVSLITPFTTCR